MRHLTPFLALALLLTALHLPARAEDSAGDLGDTMKDMADALKELKRTAADASQTRAALTAVAKLETAILKAKSQFPEKATTEEDKLAYQSQILKLLRAVIRVDEDLLKGRNAVAAKDLDDITAAMEEGHAKFRPE